jgi:hypothetical protein
LANSLVTLRTLVRGTIDRRVIARRQAFGTAERVLAQNFGIEAAAR